MTEQKDHLIPEQPAPRPSGGPDCWRLVIADMEARRLHGIAKYGQPVRPGNGRDALRDAAEEALDLCVYLRQAMEERDALLAEIARLRGVVAERKEKAP